MRYEELADDVIRFCDERNLERISLVGHNIGAKTALTTACLHADRVQGVISLDTAPADAGEQKR